MSYSNRKESYRGKNYTIPTFGKEHYVLTPERESLQSRYNVPSGHPIVESIHKPWDLKEFLTPRTPIEIASLSDAEMATLGQSGLVRCLDLPIKLPGSEYRIPVEYAQFRTALQHIVNYEERINGRNLDDYYCYITVDQRMVEPETLHREAPCHVDGFQGGRWQPKVAGNHTYTIGTALPTAYYPQPFDFSHLDEDVHDFFWEMNYLVAQTREKYKWQAQQNAIALMDCYCVHRGIEAVVPTFRTWLRVSFEVRVFDRLGNAHNGALDYAWEMVERDIEQLGLIAYHGNADPSLNVFPWQNPDGSPRTDGKKTKPRLS